MQWARDCSLTLVGCTLHHHNLIHALRLTVSQRFFQSSIGQNTIVSGEISSLHLAGDRTMNFVRHAKFILLKLLNGAWKVYLVKRACVSRAVLYFW